MENVEYGTITEEELQTYGNAGIMLLDGANNDTSSEITATGDASYNFSVTWDPELGFTASRLDASLLPYWQVGMQNYANKSEEEIRAAASQIAFALASIIHPCVVWQQT